MSVDLMDCLLQIWENIKYVHEQMCKNSWKNKAKHKIKHELWLRKPHNSRENIAVYWYIQYSKLTGRMAEPEKEKFWIIFLFNLISLPLL